MARKISVELVGDSRSLERAFARGAKSATAFNRGVEKTTRRTQAVFRSLTSGLGITTAGLGLAGVVATLKQTTDAASDLGEQVNRSGVLFGQSADEVVAWSKTTANAIGLSSAAALEGASNFGAMFETIGLADRPAAAMSQRLVQLGADMASFNNQDPSEMLDRIRSGLAGEAEPLRRFGILLSEARVQQEAYRTGLARVGSKLTEQQKVQARFNLILRDAGVQAGDFARTADEWANVQRRLGATLQDTAARIGADLLPKLAELGDRAADWLADTRNQDKIQRIVAKTIQKTSGVIRLLVGWVEKAIDIWDGFKDAIEGIVFVMFKVQIQAKRFALEMKGAGITAALGFVEPFSHIPWKGGEWARDLKENFNKELEKTAAETARIGEQIGNNYGQGFAKGAAKATKKKAKAKARDPFVSAIPVPDTGGARRAVRRGVTVAQRNTWFDAMIGRQLDRLQDLGLRKQLARLKTIAQEVRARLAVTKDATRRLTLEDQLLGILRQQRSVQAQIGDEIKAANQALKDRADAIKSAVLDRLERRQTDILNKRALADAKEQLRVARLLGGGIKAATRNLQDVQFDIFRARLENAPATLNKRGQFQLGNVVTINVHGVTDPDAVARKVADVLQRRQRRTTTQTRGPAAGTPAGAH